jgi:predicted ester cyclase
MPATENVKIFRRAIDQGFNTGNLAELDRLVAVDFVEHQFGATPGLEGLKSLVGELRTAFPELHMTIEDSVCSADKVWARLRCRGTQTGPLMGIPPAGRSTDTVAIEIGRFADGKLAEHWGVPDRFAAMTRLGLLPSAGPPQSTTRR